MWVLSPCLVWVAGSAELCCRPCYHTHNKIPGVKHTLHSSHLYYPNLLPERCSCPALQVPRKMVMDNLSPNQLDTGTRGESSKGAQRKLGKEHLCFLNRPSKKHHLNYLHKSGVSSPLVVRMKGFRATWPWQIQQLLVGEWQWSELLGDPAVAVPNPRNASGSLNYGMVWLGGTSKAHLVQPPCNEWGNLQADQGSEPPPAQPWMFPGMGQEQGQGCTGGMSSRFGVKQHLEHLEVARKDKGGRKTPAQH